MLFLFVFPLVDVVLGLSFGEVAVPVWWSAECSELPDVLAAQYFTCEAWTSDQIEIVVEGREHGTV